VDVVTLDLTDRRVLEQSIAVETKATQKARPRWVPLPLSARIDGIRHHAGWAVQWLGVFEADRLLGVGRTMISDDTPHTAWIFIDVDPEYERRGVGTALFRAAEQTLPRGIETVVSPVHRSNRPEIDSVVRGFAAPLGFDVATTETVVEVNLVDTNLLESPVAAGYRVSTYTNGVPHDMRKQVGVLKGLVDAEAPSGALEWDAVPVTPDAYAAEIREWHEEGRAAVETVAVTSDGRLVAWTCVLVPPNPERGAETQGTLVLADHRGHGLGAAVKVANLRELSDRGDVRRVTTSSDDANRWMRAINARLGFEPIEVEAILRKQHRR
jgi:GNAT superfamily N-acetyltransferase